MDKFDVILLSGGGIKGIGELGVLHYHHEKGRLDLEHAKEYVASSVGSLICLLMVCGYTPMEIFTKAYTTTNFFKPSDVNNIWDVFSKYGIMSIQPLIDIVEEMVKRKFNKLPTLLELKELTGKTLTVAAVNVTKTRVEYFNYETRPTLGAVEAVKISCNLPIIFHRISYAGNYWVDGGLIDSFPYEAVKNTTGNILGVVVMGTDTEERKDTFINYLYTLLTITINAMTQLRTKNLGKNVTLIKMVFNNASILNLTMSSTKKMDMFMKGYHNAQREQEKEILIVTGWRWEEERKAKELSESHPWGIDIPNKDHDGWEDEQWESTFGISETNLQLSKKKD